MRSLLPLIAVAALVGACGGAGAPAPSASTVPSAAAASGAGVRTVTYCTPGGTPLAMDIALPAAPAAPAPAILYIHGGGWEHGNRLGGGFLEQLRPRLVAQGFVVASIDYRLAPAAKWPAQIVDSTCAVRYLRAHASTYGIDPVRIGAWGGSAGGHLVSLLGTIDASAGVDAGEWPDVSSRVQAVVDLFGPADLTAGGWGRDPAQVLRDVFGDAPGTLVTASPVTWVTPDDPPFLILQGDADRTVPAAQSQELAKKLEDARVPVTLVMVQGGPHGLANPKQQPSPDALVATIADFFQRTLAQR